MPRITRLVSCTLMVVATACAQKVDVAAEQKALLERDQAWAILVSANGPVDSIVAYWTSDARVTMQGQPLVAGTAAIRGMVAGMQSAPGAHISWVPESAVVSASGDIGYTYGTNSVTMPDATGKPHTSEGRYIAVWRKEADGVWRCVLDTSNEGPVAAAPAPAAPR